MAKSLYIERTIRAPIERVWDLTQDPARHERWDLRFTLISYLPRGEGEPQRFLYRTNVGFGLPISGEGESVGERDGADGGRTSALRFWSTDPRSLIEEGSGFWKYVPQADGATRFFTRYDYRVRYGALGRAADLAFRPLIGWATAWSFDTLRLWAERDVPPELSRGRALVNLVARTGLALVWGYQGLVPKLLHPETGEHDLAALSGYAPIAVTLLGFAEIAFAFVLLLAPRWRLPLWLHLPALVALPFGLVEGNRPEAFVGPFNLVALSLAMLTLAVLALLAGRDLPSARNCRRSPTP